MNIYTYYAYIPEFTNRELEIIKHWKQSWKNNGWNPIVLSINTAKKHPKFNWYTSEISKKPFMNMYDYEIACFHRWIAMAQVGGGVMSDYDCLNNGLKPDNIQDYIKGGKMTIYEPPFVPCLVSGSKKEYERILDLFVSFKTSEYKQELYPHTKIGTAVSDMLILANYPKQVQPCEIVKELLNKDWKQAKVIHFSHAATKGKKLERIIEWESSKN